MSNDINHNELWSNYELATKLVQLQHLIYEWKTFKDCILVAFENHINKLSLKLNCGAWSPRWPSSFRMTKFISSTEHHFIAGQHKEEYPKIPLSCPNYCEVGSGTCENMEAYRKDWPLEMIQCEYYSTL